MKPKSFSYRPEIDGLRAIAVLAVIFFHAGSKLFPGGFFGVDIFFVISGYLITSIIFEEYRSGRFSLLSFYERRIRRILPPIFLVLLPCIFLAWMWMLPLEIWRFSQSLVAVVLFVSNIFFYRTTNYFDSNETQPLIHTWSLGVEEQFYLLYPIVLTILWRLGFRRLGLIMIFVACCSFALMVYWFAIGETPASFFLAPSRVWQLLAGAIVYLHPMGLRRPFKEILSALGVGLIFLAILFYPSGNKAPGVFALIPTFGTALVLATAGPKNLTGRLLSSRGLVSIGLFSYSAYLWHQPMFTFARFFTVTQPPLWLQTVLILATLVLGHFSWRFVETPFRERQRISRKKIFTFGAVGTLALIATGAGIERYGRDQDRFDYQTVEILSVPDVSLAKCHAQVTAELLKAKQGCVLGKADVYPSFAIIGDSHVGALAEALEERAVPEGLSFLSVSDGWCVPFYEFGNNSYPPCREMIDEALQLVSQLPKIKTVVLSAEWAAYTQGFRLGSAPVAYQDQESVEISVDKNIEVFERGLNRTLALLQRAHKKVILIGPFPEHPFNVRNTLARAAFLRRSPAGLKGVTLSAYEERNRAVLDLFATKQKELFFVDLRKIFCFNPSKDCEFVDSDGLPLYSDDNHPSLLGSRLVVNQFFQQLRN